MRISTWITSLYICGLISVNKVVVEAIERLYGERFELSCGGSPQPGEWFHNGHSTGVISSTYTITNADFSHDGYYQCRRGGVDVLGEPLVVLVYGRGSVTPLNCISTSNGVCVRNVIRGQPVTLCATFTTIPHHIPEGERVSNLSYSAWSFKNGNNAYLYLCTTSSCSEQNPSLDHSPYTYINRSCLTIDDVQENGQYTLNAFFDPQHSPRPSVIFNVTSVESPKSSLSTSSLSTSSPSPSTLPTMDTITSSITTTSINTGPLDSSEPSPGALIPAIIIPIFAVLIIVIVVAVILAAVYKLRNRKRFPLSTLNGSKLRSSQSTLQSPDIIPSKLDSGNHVNRPHRLPVYGHVLGGDGCTDTPGSQHCLLPQSPGNLNESTPVTCNGTSPQSLPPPYSFVSEYPSEGNSRDQLTLGLGTTLSQSNDDEEVDAEDFAAGPLGESKTVQIKP